jgi:hypothetical protein
MNLFLDSFWRAVVYCLHPRVIVLSLLPLVLMAVLALGLGYFYWYPALEWVRTLLESSEIFNQVWVWLEGIGAGKVKVVAGPLIVIFAVTPLIIVTALLLVAVMMSPALVALVARNRFPKLVAKREASLLLSLFWSLGSTALALIALLVSSPLWLVPPLILVLPPLIWGWLTYRVMAFDALSEHASKTERRTLFRRHRGWLLTIGIVTGFMGAAPSIVWASGVVFATMFAILVPVAIWIYTLVFAFASLWFAHFCLAALQALRNEQMAEMALVPITPPAPEAVALVHDTGDHTPPAA